MRRPLMIGLVLMTLLLIAMGVVLALQQQARLPAVTVTPGSAADVPRVTAEALRGQLAASNPPLVWDIRPTSSFAEGHIPGSRALTLDALADAAANLDRRQPIVTVCA